jgi:1-phosphofructokinase family hexose kinase
MLLCVTPNPCIERTVVQENFHNGQVHRVPPDKLRVQAGGKGINAARVAARLGSEVLCTGWIGRHQQSWFDAQLKEENLACDWVEVESDTRICLNVLDGRGGKTEIVEAGTPLSIADGTRLLQKFEFLAPRAALIALCGSYPPGESTFNAHATLLVRIAARHGKRVIYDGKGAPFETAVRSGTPPWCIAPNIEEMAELLHRPINGEAAERKAISDVLRRGVEVVLLTCGARGLWLGTRQSTLFIESPAVPEVSSVGSGDSLVGAFAAKFLETSDLVEAARWAAAAGAANAAQELSARITSADIETLLPQARVRQVQQMLPMLG